MKRLHLVVGRAAGNLPHLDRLTALARPLATPADTGLTALLARLFALETRALPALLLAAEGIPDAGRAWFRADPVHLLAGMHSVTLFDRLDLDADESRALVESLNRHFGDEITFIAPHPGRWYAGLRAPLEVDAPPVDTIAGGTLVLDRIAGPDARQIQRLAMEIQMLLHDHPVNTAREAANRASVNGVWLWGGAPAGTPAARHDRVYADDFTSQTLAQAAGLACEATPATFDSRKLADNSLVVLAEAGPETDQRWFAPVLSALRRRRLGELVLHRPDQPDHILDGWRALAFWRH